MYTHEITIYQEIIPTIVTVDGLLTFKLKQKTQFNVIFETGFLWMWHIATMIAVNDRFDYKIQKWFHCDFKQLCYECSTLPKWFP